MEKFKISPGPYGNGIRRVTEKVAGRFEILGLVKRHHMTLKYASQELGLSYRHTLRLYKRYKFGGIMALAFQREHTPWNKTPDEKKRKLLQLRTKYRDYNLLHFCDCFKEEYPEESISYSTVRRIFVKERLYSPSKKRKRPRKRFEKEKSGQLLQIDTSRHKWIPGDDRYFNFISIIDDHSRKFLYAKIVEQDTTWNNLLALRGVVKKYGIFEALYTDNDSKFKYHRKNSSLYFNYHKNPEDVHTQIDMALSKLRIQLLHTPPFDPESKGKVEKPFGMFQDRLIKEFRDNNIRIVEEANKWIDKRLEQWNSSHIHWTTKEIPDERFFRDSVFQPLPSGVNLDDVFCLRETRTVNRDNTFRFDGEVYQITGGTVSRSNWYKAEIELHIIPEKKIRIFHGDQFIQEFSLNGLKIRMEKKKLASGGKE